MKATNRRRCRMRWPALLVGLLVCAAAALAQTQVAPMPRKVQVEDVKIQGNIQIPTHRIVPFIKTRAGQDYNEETVQEDLKNLYATKMFANVNASKQFTASGGVIVFFSVVETPSKIENIRYQGSYHVKDKELETITNLKRGQPMNPIINRRACQDIVRRINEDGRPLATCELLSGDKPGDTDVIFNISDGPKVKIKAVEFRGNEHFLSSAVLRNRVDSSTAFLGMIGGKYNAMMADHDAIKLEEFYKSYGYVDCHVSREVELSPDGTFATLVFHIREGLRYHVGNVQVVGNIKAYSHEELARIPRIKSGDFVDENQIKKDENAIKDFYGHGGRQPVVRAELFYPETPGVANVVYQIPAEQTPKRMGEIKVIGNNVTRQNIIIREVPIYPGQILTYPDLRRAEANLARLGIFKVNQEGVRPHIEVEDIEGSDFSNLLVYVDEDKTGSIVFGVGVNSDAGLQGSIRFNERNFDITNWPTSVEDFMSGRAFRGAGQELTVEAVPGTTLQRYSATFREPRLFDSLFSLSVSGYYFDRSYNEYTEGRLGTRVTVGRKLSEFSDYWSVNAGLRVENVNVATVAVGAPSDFSSVAGDNFVLGFRAGVARDSRDSYLRPTDGGRVELSFEQVTGDFNFPSVTLEANRYFTIHQRADGSGKQVLALRSQISWAGDNAPVFERFYAGGFRSLRGFAFRGVGPDVNGFKTGGDFMFLNSIEYQYPIKANDQIYLVAFVDSGTVERQIEIKDYRVSAGFGVRFVVPMLGPVPIALDFGFPIVKGPGDNEQVFSFWLGWNF